MLSHRNDGVHAMPLPDGGRRIDTALEHIAGRLSHLPLRLRRRLLWLFCLVLYHGLGVRPDPGDVAQMHERLGVPAMKLRRIARSAMFHDLLFSLEWLALRNRSTVGLLHDARSVRIVGDDVLRLVANRSGVILATVHIGSYATGLAKLLHAHFQGRTVIIAKSKDANEVERGALAKLASIGVSAELLLLDRPERFVELARQLRGGAVLVTLIDLPERYGRSEEVDLLWHPARMTVGAIDLSALCRAPIVLFRTITGVRGDRIVIERAIDVGAIDPARRTAVAGEFAAFVNRAIFAHPEQWHMWGRLDEYAVDHAV